MEFAIEYSLTAEQDDIPVRGNAMASGDDDLDREVEQDIIQRLECGDVWAWAAVTVTGVAVVDGTVYTASDHLGCCTYADEKDFKAGDYYTSMQSEVRSELERQVVEAAAVARMPGHLSHYHAHLKRELPNQHSELDACTCQVAADYRVLNKRSS